MIGRRATAAELFQTALDHLSQADLEETVAHLRAGFFENLYLAPVLLAEPWEFQSIWYPAADAQPRAAVEYAERYGGLWRDREGAIELLRDLWSDTLVRSEIRSFINLSKAILQSHSENQRVDLLRERERFVNLRRIRRTQAEILARLRAAAHRPAASRPQVALLLLASRDPTASVEFWRQLFRIEPARSSPAAGGYAEFDLPGVRLAIHGHDRLAEGDPYGLGAPPASLGWGAILVLRVSDIERFRTNALAAGIDIVDEARDPPGERFFLVKDPSGYLVEITEEVDPRGA